MVVRLVLELANFSSLVSEFSYKSLEDIVAGGEGGYYVYSSDISKDV